MLALSLYHLAESQIFMPMPMTAAKATSVLMLILSMCFIAGLIAIRKLKDADPADMF